MGSITEVYRQKIFVPYFVKTKAEDAGFEIHAYAPIEYKGFNDNPMVHFAFKLMPERELPTRAVSKQSFVDIINLNIKTVMNSKISVYGEGMPRLKI